MTHQLIDVSSNNPHPIDWAHVRAAGIEAVFIKATQGTGYVNPYYRADIAAAKAAGLHACAYHFMGTADPASEARFFLSVAGGDARLLDVETSTNTAWINAFLADLGVASGQEMTYGSASSLPSNVDRGLLMPAEYGPAPGRGECWQYTETGQVPGIQGNVDRSVWTGTEEQWNAFWGLAVVQSTSGKGGNMLAYDPVTGGTWALRPSGAVFADGGAPYLGGLNNHPQYNAGAGKAAGPAVGIAPFGPGGQGGYEILCDNGTSPQPARYRFPRDGSLAK